MTYRNSVYFDQALQFAEDYQRTYPYCRQMVRYFQVFGRLSDKQVDALLRIRLDHFRKTRGL
jgi:hypothetical protein